MKHRFYKNSITIFALCLLGTLNAQKYEKKYSENFKVNKDVEVAINASNTDINVSTWNKNEVKVDAFIEIEGLTKEEAEKYFKNWNFEALGNSKTVRITSKGNSFFGSSNDFVFFNDMDFKFPEIEMPNFDSIVFPEMNFDFDFNFDGIQILEDLEDLDKIVGKDGKYSFEWNDGVDKISIKSKKEWETFKKSKKYKELKEKMSVTKTKMKKKYALSKDKMKERIEKAKLEFKNIDKEKIKKELSKAKEQIMKMRLQHGSNANDITINGKKIKIKKRLEIKVPKNATFNLNTRHCKVKLPNTKASGKVSYGGFDANDLFGGKLTIDYSKVSINDLNGCTLFLNNVTDARIASVTNSTMNNNSSGVNIITINENVDLTHKYGELNVNVINPNFNSFKLNLNYSDATLPLENLVTNMDVDTKKTKFLFSSKKQNFISKMFYKMVEQENSIINGKMISDKKTDNLIKLIANYSVLNVN